MTKIFLAIRGNSFPTHPVLLTPSLFSQLCMSFRSVLGKTVLSVLCTARGQDLGHSFSQYGPRAQFFPLRTSLLVNNIYISTSPTLFTRICMAAIGKNYGEDIGNSKKDMYGSDREELWGRYWEFKDLKVSISC